MGKIIFNVDKLNVLNYNFFWPEQSNNFLKFEWLNNFILKGHNILICDSVLPSLKGKYNFGYLMYCIKDCFIYDEPVANKYIFKKITLELLFKFVKEIISVENFTVNTYYYYINDNYITVQLKKYFKCEWDKFETFINNIKLDFFKLTILLLLLNESSEEILEIIKKTDLETNFNYVNKNTLVEWEVGLKFNIRETYFMKLINFITNYKLSAWKFHFKSFRSNIYYNYKDNILNKQNEVLTALKISNESEEKATAQKMLKDSINGAK